MGLIISLVACICTCICAAKARADVNDAEIVLGRAQRRLLEAAMASMAAAAAAEEPAEPDKPEVIVELAVELPLLPSSRLGMNTSGDAHGKGIVFRSFSMAGRLSNKGVLFDGCRILAVFHQYCIDGEDCPCGRTELSGLSHSVALKALALHIEWDLVKERMRVNASSLSVVLVVAAPNMLSAPMVQQPEPENAMPLEQEQAEASLAVQCSNVSKSVMLYESFSKTFEYASLENAPALIRFRDSANCVKIKLAGDYFSIYGTGATFTSFVKYERVRGAKKNDSNSFDNNLWRTWLEGGLVFSGFSTPDCELARLGFLVEGCHLVGTEISSIFRPIKGFMEESDVKNFIAAGSFLVFRNVAKSQAIEVVSA
jgi:hypothetical protein